MKETNTTNTIYTYSRSAYLEYLKKANKCKTCKEIMKEKLNYFKVSVEDIIEKLTLESQKDKNYTTCQYLINMLENSNLNTLTIEHNKSGKGFNKGSMVECLVRSAILNYLGINNTIIQKSWCNTNDINLSKRNKETLQELQLDNINYEIKLITPLARGARISENNTCDKFIIVDLRQKKLGAWLVNKNDLVLYTNCNPTDNAFESVKDFTKGVYLNTLTEILGIE